MISKWLLSLCFLLTVALLTVEAQRDSRRRSGRRKATTESPLEEETESGKTPQKADPEPESEVKLPSDQKDSSDSEITSPTSPAKESGNQGGPPFIVPRGTRKPRPMHVRNEGEVRPRPTLPTFARKSHGRLAKADRHDLKRNDAGADVTTTTTTTSKPSRGGSSRRRNSSSQASEKRTTEKVTDPVETPEESQPGNKKRFGGAGRRPSRGSRRNTVAPEES